MRIALVTSSLSTDTRGGAEKYAEDAARSLSEHHDVIVLTGSQNELEGIRIVRLPGLRYYDVGSGTFASRVFWHARDQWLPSVHFALMRALREEAPDVIWTHEPQGLSAAVFTAVARRGLPHVHTAHDLNLMCARTSMTRDGEYCGGRCFECRIQRQIRGRAIGMRLDRFIGVSNYIRDRHVQAGVVSAAQAETIRLGAPAGTSRLRRLANVPATIGFIGALSPHKGISTLLHAVETSDETWRLLVAGTGRLEADVVGAAGRDARIEYVGYVDGEAKDSFFDRLDLIAIPSEWEEPAALVAPEAAVRGIPAVVADRGGLPETPEARTFRSGDAGHLAEALRWFLEDPQRLEHASERLLRRKSEFEWPAHLARVERVLEQAVQEQPAWRAKT